MLIFLKDTSQRGSDIRRFGSTTAAEMVISVNTRDTARCMLIPVNTNTSRDHPPIYTPACVIIITDEGSRSAAETSDI